MLFCGDIEEKAERRLLDIYGDTLRADVLKVPHHGSASATNDALLEAVPAAVCGNLFGRRQKFTAEKRDAETARRPRC